MKKAFIFSGFFCLCVWIESSAQTTSDANATGTPVSASRDVVISGSATIEKTDSTGTSIPQEKSAQGPMISAPADNKQSTGSDKLSSDKKPH